MFIFGSMVTLKEFCLSSANIDDCSEKKDVRRRRSDVDVIRVLVRGSLRDRDDRRRVANMRIEVEHC